MEQYITWVLSILSIVTILFLFYVKLNQISERKELGVQTLQGSEIKANKKLKKFRSVKDVPKIKNILGKSNVVAYFNHSRCSGCVSLTPKFEILANSIDIGNNDVSYININPQKDNVDFSSIGIIFVPTVLIFDKDGDLVKNIIGLIDGSADLVISAIEQALIPL